MPTKKITHANVRMYRMGTGDCYVIKFMRHNTIKFKMMIDGGAWSSMSSDELTPYVKDLKKYVSNHINLLVITHEHLDHVLAFDRCDDLFKDKFKVDQIWMGWTENDKDIQVKRWKREHGQKKKALGMAAEYVQKVRESGELDKQFQGSRQRVEMLAAKHKFSKALSDFADLHLGSSQKKYIGDIKGIKVIKEDIANNNIDYLEAGEIKTVEQLEGVRFFVLGPSTQWEDVEKKSGAPGETYKHNKDLNETEAFAAAALSLEDGTAISGGNMPFDADFLASDGMDIPVSDETPEHPCNRIKQIYSAEDKDWRRIDYDWLQGAGSLALRLNSHTNNLSLVLAIEFEENGKVMLFTGDAEFGSWKSWHEIEWGMTGKDEEKHLTEDLLNRTVFYKVAHHLSNNGTARSIGLEMMTDSNLAAMASLDYNVISNGWKSTMPNHAIVKELLKRTKGRLMIMNEKDIFLNKSETEKVHDKIEEARGKMNPGELSQFKNDFVINKLYLQYRVRA